MDFKTEAKIIETVLFMESEPTDINSLSRITKLSKEIIIEAIKHLQAEFEKPDHGIELVEIGGGYTFSPKKELWEILKTRYGKKNDNRLSRAALETLSIIAYSQPITKGEIESIRGVAAEGMIKVLIAKDLIKEVGKKDIPGKPIQYGTTKAFLKIFRLKSIVELPKLDDVENKKFIPNEQA
jgi:segregation and condensation protein B